MPNEKLQVSFIQSNLVWENPEANLRLFSEKIDAIKQEVDLIVLPEMFTTGFTMHTSCVTPELQEMSLEWMKTTAKKKNARVMGSVIHHENEAVFNRLWVVSPDGNQSFYDKKHLFTLAKEHEHFSAGKQKLLVEIKGWKISPLICYDLRFPVWARNVEDYDLLLYVANWPEIRVNAWDALLKARAIENMAYCLGVNRSGEDGKGFAYSGHSAMYDMLGNQISTQDNKSNEFVEVVELDYNELQKTREKLGFLKDKDSFSLDI